MQQYFSFTIIIMITIITTIITIIFHLHLLKDFNNFLAIFLYLFFVGFVISFYYINKIISIFTVLSTVLFSIIYWWIKNSIFILKIFNQDILLVKWQLYLDQLSIFDDIIFLRFTSRFVKMWWPIMSIFKYIIFAIVTRERDFLDFISS